MYVCLKMYIFVFLRNRNIYVVRTIRSLWKPRKLRIALKSEKFRASYFTCSLPSAYTTIDTLDTPTQPTRIYLWIRKSSRFPFEPFSSIYIDSLSIF